MELFKVLHFYITFLNDKLKKIGNIKIICRCRVSDFLVFFIYINSIFSYFNIIEYKINSELLTTQKIMKNNW